MNSICRFLFFFALLGCGAARAEDAWETTQTSPLIIKTRKRAGTDVKEVWAEGTIAATPIDIQSTLTDVPRFSKFMPYIAEARSLGEMEADGGLYVYSKLDLPVLSARDFVHKSYIDRDARKDPQGVFANHWYAVPDKVPRRAGVVRLQISEGSWVVTPLGDGKSHVVYHFSVDPAGSIPAFAANRSNASGVDDTFKNVERESQRRAAERAASRTP